jgi:hydrogenase nickel incorporation protein HypA/HybF
MHEFSIAQNIVEIALEAAQTGNAGTVSCVDVEVGQVSGVVPEALDFAWESARKDTLLRNASLAITVIPLRVKCRVCGLQHNPEDWYGPCPACGAINYEILSGKELRVTAIHT